MRRIVAWLSVAGGLLWGLKPIYDYYFNGRRMNTGYEPTWFADYIAFLFPLLCLGSLILVYALYRKQVRLSVIVLAAAVILTSCFQFFEIYFYGSDLPFGFIFLFTGTMCMIIGSVSLYVQLRKASGERRVLPRLAAVLFWDNILMIAAATLAGVFPEETMNTIAMIAMIAVGFLWAAFGLAVIGSLRESAPADKYSIAD